MDSKALTDKQYWESRWDRLKLPMEANSTSSNLLTKRLITILLRYAPKRDGLSILEIGGAPGQWLAFFHRTFHYKIHAIDYSEKGCGKMRQNFDLLHVPATIYHRDVLKDDLADLPAFDIVYSLGFIEHFDSLNTVVERHLHLLKKGGLLIIGVPNFLGISRLVLRKTAPLTLSMHNLRAMEKENWRSFEEEYGLESLFGDYVGGFHLCHCLRCEKRTFFNLAIRSFFKSVRFFTDRMDFLAGFNSKHWSPYLLGIYRKGF